MHRPAFHIPLKRRNQCPLSTDLSSSSPAPNGGIGAHFVHDTLARGAAKVYATARSPRAWDDERIVPLTLDVTDRASIAAAVAAAADVTVLVNNAGAIPPSASLLDVTEADIRANMETNFLGPVLLARAFAPVLAAKKGSMLIDVQGRGDR